MSTLVSPPLGVREQRVLMRNVSWETYEGLLAANVDSSSPRMSYDHGVLEIMSPSLTHENLKEILAMIADMVAEEFGIEFLRLGSATFRRRDFKQGAEPDSCFYIQNAERIRGKSEADLTVDPPPDLVIEVEVTSPALDKLPIWARLGVPELWLTDGEGVRILQLDAGEYKPARRSAALPALTEAVLSDFLRRSQSLTTLAWRKLVRDWARERSRSADFGQ
jgi:Uma2 family endonuclease